MVLAIEKNILMDENEKPVAVQIRYEDWLEIEAMLDAVSSDVSNLERHKGVLRLRMNPMEFQKRVREEWD